MEKQISVYRHIVKLLFQLNAPEEAFAYTERSKAQSFLEQLYEASIRVKHGVDQQLLMEETHLYDKLFVIEQNLRKAPNNQNREQLLKERHSLEYELSVLQMTLRTSDPRYAELSIHNLSRSSRFNGRFSKKERCWWNTFRGKWVFTFSSLEKQHFIPDFSEKQTNSFQDHGTDE